MSILSGFDINNNFWQENPTFKVIEKFSDFYKKDTSKDKWSSSVIMWGIALLCENDKSNRLRNFSEEEKKEIIKDDYIKINSFKWDKYKDLIELYVETQLTRAQKSLRVLKIKMEEREKFLQDSTYTLDNAKELDVIFVNTSKLFDMMFKLESQIEKEEASDGSGAVKGGRVESAGERREL